MKTRGKKLDTIGALYNVKRKKYWWIFKEFDSNYRKRVTKATTHHSAIYAFEDRLMSDWKRIYRKDN
jgi:hypothetical protein